MGAGPILIFDKSALQGLTLHEAMLLDALFLTNITPLFYVEVLGDLEKIDPRGHTPEAVVAELAQKTPEYSSTPNAYHGTLVLTELLGQRTDMSRRPNVPRGVFKRAPDGTIGFHVKESPEAEMLQRWTAGDFSETDRGHARGWRTSIAGIDLGARVQWVQRLVPAGERIADLEDARRFARAFVEQSGKEILLFALEFMSVPSQHHRAILERYAAAGEPPLATFAPYAAYVLHVDLVFYLGIAKSQIGAERATNAIDLAYLYYLPFCMVFTSQDKLHRRLAPLFLRPDQAFVPAEALKDSLSELAKHYATREEEIARRGIMFVAAQPPLDIDNEVSRLWDRFLPGWRERSEARSDTGAPTNDDLLERIEALRLSGEQEPHEGWDGEPDFVLIERRVRPAKGSWRVLPEGIEAKER